MVKNVVKVIWEWRGKRRFSSLHAKLNIGQGTIIDHRLLQPSRYSRVSVGSNSIIYAGLACQKEGAELTVGNEVFIGGRTSIVSTERVNIGNHVLISFGCYISDTDGYSLDYLKRKNDVRDRLSGGKDWSLVESEPISIGDHSWIGPNVIVLKGITIGKGVVVGAGSIVTKDLPDFVLAAGNPARIICQLEATEKRV